MTETTRVSSWHTTFHPHPVNLACLKKENTRTYHCHKHAHTQIHQSERNFVLDAYCIQVQLIVSLLCLLCNNNQPIQFNNNKLLHFVFMFSCMSCSSSIYPFYLLLYHQVSFIWKSAWWLNHRESEPDQSIAGCQWTLCSSVWIVVWGLDLQIKDLFAYWVH